MYHAKGSCAGPINGYPDILELYGVQDRNTVLADEMGLGKTVQCVSLVGLLAQHMQLRGPFLVVVPLSTVPNWIKEFRKWVPMVSCRVVVRTGVHALPW